MQLILDVSSLGHGAWGQRHRTGLFQVADAYAQGLRERSDVTLGLYSSSGNRFLAARYLRTTGWSRQPWVGSPAASLLCFLAASLEFAVYRSPLRPMTPFLSNLKVLCQNLRSRVDRKALARWDAYLSPMEAIPEEIRAIPTVTSALVIHDLIPLVLPEYRQNPADPTRWFSKMWGSLLPKDLIFAVSEATRQDILVLRPSFPADRVTVVPNAVDRARFHPSPVGRDDPFFLAVSTIEPRKRLDAVLGGYHLYRKAGGTARLVIGGVDRKGSVTGGEGIQLLGFVTDEDLPALYAACTAFLSFSEYEGFGLPILEAMACGAPVILSNRASHPEVAGSAGIYIDPDDLPGIALALARVADYPVERARRSHRSLLRAAEFSWDKTLDLVVGRIQKERKVQP